MATDTSFEIHSRPLLPLRILLAQENEQEILAFRQTLEQRYSHYEIITAVSSETLFEQLDQDAPLFDVVIVDHQLADVLGLELCRHLLAKGVTLPLILLCKIETQHLVVEALEAGVYDYVLKDEQQGYLQVLPLVISRVVQRYRDNIARQNMETIVKEVFSRVERAKQEWEATIDSLPQAVCLVDKQGRIMRANRTVETWQLSQVKDVKGKTIHDLLHPNCAETDCSFMKVWRQAWEIVQRGEMAEFETEDTSGPYHFFWQIRPVVVQIEQREKSDESFATVVIHDSTERKQAEKVLQESLEQKELAYQQAQMYARDLQREVAQRERAQASLRQYANELQARNEELDAFAHTVAHDLKNPLGPIIGYAKVAIEGDIPLTSQDIELIMQSILRNGYKMNAIIEALLLLAGVRNMDIEPTPLDMAQIVNETLTRFDSMIKEYQPEVILPDSWPVALGFDPWIEEVWANYLSNGLKYGGRPPRLEFGANKETDGMVRFWLEDNGAGLTPEQQNKLFTPFTRLSQIRLEGHGLGLSIVHRIVERLGGRVGVESVEPPKQGSRFYFILPGL